MHERLKFFLWKVAWDILSTRMKFAEKLQDNFLGTVLCPLCGAPEESINHLFFYCSYSHFIWRIAPWPLSVDVFGSGHITQWIQAILDPPRRLGIPEPKSQDFQIVLASRFHFIEWLGSWVQIHIVWDHA